MSTRQKHTLVVERRVIRADGRPRPGDHNQVVGFWSDDGDAERAMTGGGLLDRTGYTPLAEHVHEAHISDEYLEMIERQRWMESRR